jgi:hypothetical protein
MFEPQDPSESGLSPGLAEAHELVDRAWDYGDPIEYWRIRIDDQRPKLSFVKLKREYTPPSKDESDSDPDIREAMRRSRAEMKPGSKTALLTPSASPPNASRIQRATPQRSNSNSHGDILRHFQPTITPTPPNKSRSDSRRPTNQEDVVEGSLYVPLLVTITSPTNLPSSHSSDSKSFVEFLIGPDKVQFLIPRHEIKRREYFEVIHHKYEQPKGETTWAVVMPCLATIEPDDFQFVAEFLSTGNFGIRVVDDSNRDSVMAQCIATWDVADQLGIQELLDLIVTRAQAAMPWSTEEVTYFSGVVYRVDGSVFGAHVEMKKLLAGYIADNFWDMVENFGRAFTDDLKQIPELERDIFARLRDDAEKKVEAEAEVEMD